MQLYSLQFALFLALSLVAYYAVGRAFGRGQWVVLLVASLGFFLASGWENLLFVLVTGVSTWGLGLALGKLDDTCGQRRAAAKGRAEKRAIRTAFRRRKWHVLFAALCLNLGVLGYVKYWNVLLGYLGLGRGFMASGLLLPLGISFYTFMALSYVIDVYNAKHPPEKNVLRYLLYVSYFPQLLQGPINRFSEMSGQMYERHTLSPHAARRALLLLGFGIMKKYAMGDTLATPIAAMLDSIDAGTPGATIAFGILLYTIQQYADFSGGIDMVRAVSQLFGIRMAENFRQPYFSTTLSEFWRRWHMSLGAWMRDYVFYPLALRPSLVGLNKWLTARVGKGVGRTASACISNVIVFSLVGLWHGAETHYLLWGLYQGVVIAASDVMRPLFERVRALLHVDDQSRAWRTLAILRTFLLVNIGRYFDRIADFGDLTMAFRNTLLNFRPELFFAWFALNPVRQIERRLLVAALSCAIVFVVSVRRERGEDVGERLLSQPLVVRVALCLFVGTLVAFSFSMLRTGGGFLYENF